MPSSLRNKKKTKEKPNTVLPPTCEEIIDQVSVENVLHILYLICGGDFVLFNTIQIYRH